MLTSITNQNDISSSDKCNSHNILLLSCDISIPQQNNKYNEHNEIK